MAPGRVMAPPPGGTKIIMTDIEQNASARVTRHKAALVRANTEESQLLKDGGSQQNKHGWRSSMHMGEGSEMHMDARLGVTNQSLTSPAFSEQLEQYDGDNMALVIKKRKGAGLERLTKGLGAKIAIEIPEGLKRPEKPIQAAKLASECGYVARSMMPVYPHFKEFKKDPKLLENFICKVAANFEMDTTSDDVQKTCINILKKVSKNRRHLIKKNFFDNVQAKEVSIKSPVEGMLDSDWQKLVELWSTPKHKKTCGSAKKNRKKVKF